METKQNENKMWTWAKYMEPRCLRCMNTSYRQKISVNKIVFVSALNWQQNRWQLSCSCPRVILVFFFIRVRFVRTICSCRWNRMIIRQFACVIKYSLSNVFSSLQHRSLIDLLFDTESCMLDKMYKMFYRWPKFLNCLVHFLHSFLFIQCGMAFVCEFRSFESARADWYLSHK